MKREFVDDVLAGLTEKLAALEHERWSHWQRYLQGKGELQSDGSLVLPAELVARWKRQMSTEYADLNEDEKRSDREQVGRYLSLITNAFVDQTPQE